MDTRWFDLAIMELTAKLDEEVLWDPAAPNHGFSSWNDYSTRQMLPAARDICVVKDEGTRHQRLHCYPVLSVQQIRLYAYDWQKETNNCSSVGSW